MFNPIQNQGLCLGALSASPVDSLCVEANELPLHLKWKKLSLQFAAQVQ